VFGQRMVFWVGPLEMALGTGGGEMKEARISGRPGSIYTTWTAC
jgi:hypothetical protein